MRNSLLFAAAVLTSGCISPEPPPAAEDTLPQPSAVQQSPSAEPPPVEQRLEAPDRVAVGDSATFRLRLVNRSDRVLALLLTGARSGAYDFRVTRPDGELVWALRGDQPVPAVGFPATLGPGESLDYAAGWDLRDRSGRPVVPGVYHVRGLAYTDLPLSWTPAEAIIVAP